MTEMTKEEHEAIQHIDSLLKNEQFEQARTYIEELPPQLAGRVLAHLQDMQDTSETKMTEEEHEAIQHIIALFANVQFEQARTYIEELPPQPAGRVLARLNDAPMPLSENTPEDNSPRNPMPRDEDDTKLSEPPIQSQLRSSPPPVGLNTNISRSLNKTVQLRDREFELAENAWDAANRACGTNFSSKDYLDADFFKDAFRQLRRSDIGQFSETGASETVIFGFPSEVGERLKEMVQEKNGDAESQLRILRGVCANSLGELQEESKAGPEELTDISVSIIDTSDFTNTNIAYGVLKIMPLLRGLLDEEASHDKGWYMSLIGLGVTLSVLYERTTLNRIAREARLLGGVYYHEILRQACENPIASPSPEVIRQAATNLAATLGYLSRNQDGDVRIRLENTAQILRRISIGVSMELISSNTKSSPNNKAEIINRLGIKDEALGGIDANSFFVLLDMLTMASVEDSTREIAYLEASAAVARICLGHGERVASGFFNAGVTLNRMDEKDLISVRSQAILHALGLFWSLKMESDVSQAMNEGNGYSCGINLLSKFSALIPAAKDETRQLFLAVAEQIFACRQVCRPSLDDDNKLYNLQKRFVSEIDLKAGFDQQRLMPHLIDLVRHLGSEEFSVIPINELSVEETASLVQQLFGAILGKSDASWSPTESIRELVSPYINAISPLIKKEIPLKSYVATHYSEKLRKSGPFSFVDDGKGGRELLSQKEWENLLSRSKNECKSVREAFRTSFAFTNQPK